MLDLARSLFYGYQLLKKKLVGLGGKVMWLKVWSFSFYNIMAGVVERPEVPGLSWNKMFWKERACDLLKGEERNNAMWKMTCGSRKLKDALRKRLKEHVKLRRDRYVSGLRYLGEDETDVDVGCTGEIQARGMVGAGVGYVGAECKDWQPNDELELHTLEEIAKEQLTKEEEWYLKQCEEFLREGDAVLDSLLVAISSEGVLCPLCSRGMLAQREGRGLVECAACGASFRWARPLPDLGSALCRLVDAHHGRCSWPAGFTLVPEGDSHLLIVACTSCGLFSVV